MQNGMPLLFYVCDISVPSFDVTNRLPCEQARWDTEIHCSSCLNSCHFADFGFKLIIACLPKQQNFVLWLLKISTKLVFLQYFIFITILYVSNNANNLYKPPPKKSAKKSIKHYGVWRRLMVWMGYKWEISKKKKGCYSIHKKT